MDLNLDYIAALSDLEVPDEKRAKYEKDILSILEMLGQLPDVSGVQDELNLTEKMDLRQDKATSSLSRDDALRNAQQVQAGCVVVPKTVE